MPSKRKAAVSVQTNESENVAESVKHERTPRKRIKTEHVEGKTEIEQTPTPTKSKGRTTKKPLDWNIKSEDQDLRAPEQSHSKAKTSAKGEAQKSSKKATKVDVDPEKEELKDVPAATDPVPKAEDGPKIKRKRKTKEEKEAEAMPLAVRTVGHKLFIGAHVSSAGGVQNSVANSIHIGGNSFALFLKSQRKWANPAMTEESCTQFLAHCREHKYDQARHVVPHGSYLVNLAHTDPARTTQAYDSFAEDLKRCERLGISLYNFHPGNTVGTDRATAIAHLASNLNRAHAETSKVVTLLENMAAGGNVLGSTFEDLRDIIALINDKSRVGVCIDTCHAFAYGYDLRTPKAFAKTMDEFSTTVGLQYLRAVHMNDSKAPFSSKRDLHANIGTGFLGLRAFHSLVNDARFAGIPLVLETPIEVRDDNGAVVNDEKGKPREDKTIWATEIKLLESLVGMDAESEEFLTLEEALARKGEPERKRLMEQQDRKREKELKKANKPARKKGVKKEESSSEDEDDAENE